MDELKTYVNIYVKIPEEFYEFAIGHISEYPISGIEEKTDELVITIPSPFYNETVKKMIQEDLVKVCPNARIIHEEILIDQNWNEQWEQTISPIIINDKIAITPEWHVSELNQEYIIVINPKMSFGTGHHATTRMMCSLLYDNVKPGSRWIDAGTGTGVLAILASKFGAGEIFAFDNDEWSADNAKENVKINGCENLIDIKQIGILEAILPEADGIAANLYTHLLKPSFPKFYESLCKSNGCLLISGVLIYDKEEIIKAAANAGFIHIRTIQEDEWIAVQFSAGKSLS